MFARIKPSHSKTTIPGYRTVGIFRVNALATFDLNIPWSSLANRHSCGRKLSI